MLTGLIVLSGAAAVASGGAIGAEGPAATLASGLRGIESMRLSDVGRTIAEWRLGLLIAGSILVLILLWGGDAIRPGSIARSGIRDVKPLPVPVWIMGACIVLLAPMLVATPVSRMTALVGEDAQALRAVAVTNGVAYLAGVAVAFGLLIMAGKAAPNAGLKFDWIDGPVGLGLLLLVAPLVLLMGDLSALVHRSLTAEGTAALAHPLLTLMTENAGSPWTWLLIAGAVIGAPIVEEVVYRGFLQSGLLRLTGHAWVSAIIAAVVFGVVHTLGGEDSGVPWYAAVQVGVLGLCCGAAFERTKRIGVPIAMHAAFNAVNIAVAMWVMD